jgi:hypothetical protein
MINLMTTFPSFRYGLVAALRSQRTAGDWQGRNTTDQ